MFRSEKSRCEISLWALQVMIDFPESHITTVHDSEMRPVAWDLHAWYMRETRVKHARNTQGKNACIWRDLLGSISTRDQVWLSGETAWVRKPTCTWTYHNRVQSRGAVVFTHGLTGYPRVNQWVKRTCIVRDSRVKHAKTTRESRIMRSHFAVVYCRNTRVHWLVHSSMLPHS